MQFVFCLWFYKAYILIGAQKQNLTEIYNINLSESLWCKFKCRKLERDEIHVENVFWLLVKKQILTYITLVKVENLIKRLKCDHRSGQNKINEAKTLNYRV